MSIHEFIKTNDVTVPERLRMIARAADAIQAAHTRGVIHRDLKPGNILVVQDSEGAAQPKVVDFGIARLTGADVTIAGTVERTSGLIGTLRYMSPEQLSGNADAVDARSGMCMALARLRMRSSRGATRLIRRA